MNGADEQDMMESIAIIGMTGRFPGANDINEFWQNLRAGIESISFFSDEEIDQVAIDPAELHDPNYVKARGILTEVEKFDAHFFGFTPREAEITDPQHRLLLECCWEALEHAGYDVDKYRGTVGVYAGAGANTYLLYHLSAAGLLTDSSTVAQAFIYNKNDHLTGRIAYKLNLKGPGVTVQTACSTSLVAVSMACQGLLDYQIDMALAGGVTVVAPQKIGYLFREGGIYSNDGHCRAFDAKAKGAVSGNGAGVVVLKRLRDALADGDHIWAVIRGSAINNDGALKAGYTSPSVDRQAEVIALAQGLAGVDPEQITYIEAHGTGTPLGDPIEIEALTNAFRLRTEKKGFCAVGSVKTAIGHLDTAAGVAGLIKTALMLHHKMIPPSLHFETPNPQLDLANSPFFINTKLRDWETGSPPRRAGVSSFGLSGTNAHAVLEEAPDRAPSGQGRAAQLLLISAKTAPALEDACANLVDFFKQNPNVNLADVAHTLRVGRKAFEHRRMFVCSDVTDATATLEALTPHRVYTAVQEPIHRPLVFMFPGQGSQYVNMTAELYQAEPLFRAQVDLCAELLAPMLQLDLRTVLYPSEADSAAAAQKLDQTWLTQPALFAVEYALAKLLMAWGIRPSAMIGHSLGEYVAACLAEVFSLPDALTLVAARARLMQNLAGGAMLVVPFAESKVADMLGAELSLAAVNGVGQCVMSGPLPAVERLEQELTAQGTIYHRLRTAHAFHSKLMEPALEPFIAEAQKIKFNPPRIPFISNLTATWIKPEEATTPQYWADHLRQTVRFAAGVEELLQEPETILLEVGPGRTLRTLARWHPHKKPGQLVFSSLPKPHEQQSDVAFLARTLGHLWLAGGEADWLAYNAHEERRRLPLPTYPFQRQRYWVELRPQGKQLGARRKAYGKQANLADWFHLPVWKETTCFAPSGLQPSPPVDKTVLLFADDSPFSARLRESFAGRYREVIYVRPGTAFRQYDEATFELNPARATDYDELFKALLARAIHPALQVHLWSLTPPLATTTAADQSALEAADAAALEQGFFSLIFLAQALGRLNITKPVTVVAITNGVRQVTGRDPMTPEKATVLGPCLVMPREYPNVTCRSIDITVPAAGSWQEEWLAEQLLEEVGAAQPEPVVAYRDNRRWLQTYEPIRLPQAAERPALLKDGGVYLITGGLGGLGLEVAHYLARTCKAKLSLVSRSALPEREKWPAWCETHDERDEVFRRISRIQQIEQLGAEVLLAHADVSDEQAMRAVLAQTRASFGGLDGIIHAAGVPAGGLMQIKTREAVAAVLAPKVAGARVLERLLVGDKLDFFLLFSSLSSIVGRFGQVDYTAANAFLDAFAPYYYAKTGVPTITINWGAWEEVGMAAGLFRHGHADPQALKQLSHPLLDRRVVEEEGRQVYFTEFSPERHWVLDEHRIAGYPVIPGVAFFEMVRAALGEQARGRTLEYRDVFFLSMLRVGIGEKREVRLVLQPAGEWFNFTIRSQANGANGTEATFKNYAIGMVRIGAPEPPREYDLASFRDRCNVQHIILAEEDREEDLGPRWQSVQQIYVGANEIFIPLEIPEAFAADFAELKFHPALLDRLTGLTKKYLAKGPYLPFTYRKLTLRGDLPRKVYGYARYKEEESLSRETINFDLKLMDEAGRALVEIEGFGQKLVNDPADEIRALSDLKLGARAGETKQTGAPDPLAAELSAEPTDAQANYLRSIRPEEGVETLARILAARLGPQVIVSAQDLQTVIEQAGQARGERVLAAMGAQQSAQRLAPKVNPSAPYEPPENEAERKIAEVWQEILGVERVGIHDNFFELGGTSLFAIQALARLRQEFDMEIPPATVFEGATVSALARLLVQAQGETPAFTERQSRGERRKAKAQDRLKGKTP